MYRGVFVFCTVTARLTLSYAGRQKRRGMRIAIATVGVSVVVATCGASAVGADTHSSTPSSKPNPITLPYQTRAKGADGPEPYHVVPQTPAALIRGKHLGWVYLNVYAGLFDVSGYDMTIRSVSIVGGRFQVKATLNVPTLFGPGTSRPYQFIRIRRSAIHGKVPETAYLVQAEQKLKPHTSIKHLVAFARKVGGKIVSATLVSKYDSVKPWTQAGNVFGPPIWYIRCVGNLHFGVGFDSEVLSPTGYYLINDETGGVFSGGFP
jgi:hypothetical protein